MPEGAHWSGRERPLVRANHLMTKRPLVRALHLVIHCRGSTGLLWPGARRFLSWALVWSSYPSSVSESSPNDSSRSVSSPAWCAAARPLPGRRIVSHAWSGPTPPPA
eukprot:scaffold26903_cov129-Isochrysis_galbana.AAC.3